MESEKDVEIIKKAIRKLMEEEEMNAETSSSHESFEVVDEDEDNGKPGGRRHHKRQLLSRLLTQLESLEEDSNKTEESKQEAHVEKSLSSEIAENNTIEKGVSSCSNEEIIKELKNVKRQNLITHCLVTAMIVLTLTWQLSEVSLILKIKDGLSNPFKSIGGLFGGFLKNRPEVNVQDAMKQASKIQKQVIEPTSLPGLKIPELPWPGFDTSDEE